MQAVRFVGVGRPPRTGRWRHDCAAGVYAKLKVGQISGRAVLLSA